MNQIIVIGHLGRDPEMKYTPSGEAVTSFSVASSRKYKTAAGDQREETQWFNISCWSGLAELANQFLVKGRQVFIQGRLKVRTYEGRNGDTMVSVDVTAEKLQFLGGKSDSGGASAPGEQDAEEAGTSDDAVAMAADAGHHVVVDGDVSNDDLPF